MVNMIKEWARNILYEKVKNGSILVTNEQYDARMAKCVGCKYNGLVEVPIVKIMDSGCTKCGCPFETKARIYKIVSPIIKARIYKKAIIHTELVECTHEDGNKWADIDKNFNNNI